MARSIAEHLQRVLDFTTLYANNMGSILIVCIVVLVNLDVLGRNLLGAPLAGVPELVSASIVVIVYLQVAHAFQQGHLTRSLIFIEFVGKYSRRGRALLELALSSLAALLIGQLLVSSWPLLAKAWARQSYSGTVGSFTLLEWPVKLIIVFGCTLLLVQILVKALASLFAIWHAAPAPDTNTSPDR